MGEQDAGEPADALDVSGAIRALRRRVDVSQRELAASSGVPVATVGRIESGYSRDPRLRTVERLVRATGARLAIVDLDGTEPAPLGTDEWRDRAGRRFPPHLDSRPVNRWRRGAAEDVISFLRNRWVRDVFRRDRAGERRCDLFTEIRRLGPGDAELLATLRQQAAELSLAGEPAPRVGPLTHHQALRYLRDPSLRHWIAEDGPGVRTAGGASAARPRRACRRWWSPRSESGRSTGTGWSGRCWPRLCAMRPPEVRSGRSWPSPETRPPPGICAPWASPAAPGARSCSGCRTEANPGPRPGRSVPPGLLQQFDRVPDVPNPVGAP